MQPMLPVEKAVPSQHHAFATVTTTEPSAVPRRTSRCKHHRCYSRQLTPHQDRRPLPRPTKHRKRQETDRQKDRNILKMIVRILLSTMLLDADDCSDMVYCA